MHIEKNINNILGTILNIKGKMNDDLAARKDLQEMSLRPKLYPYMKDDGRTYLPVACHTMSKDNKS
jgi:hypothetical protein